MVVMDALGRHFWVVTYSKQLSRDEGAWFSLEAGWLLRVEQEGRM